jgi:hypothetical protein
MSDPSMRLHPLASDVRCPSCGTARLTFIRVGNFGDLYCCASGGPCKCAVLHYRNKASRTCGYAVIYNYGSFGGWTACAAAKGE